MDPLIIRNLIIENTIYSIVIVLFLLIASPSSYSIENKNISNQDLIQFEQKQWLESAQRQRQNLKQKPRIASDKPILISDDENRCFTIESINLIGMTVFLDKQKNKLIENYLGKCLTINNIQSIAQLIQNYYIKKGYITVQVSLPEQDLTLKILTILIIEGIIESIEIQNSPTRTVNMIYPNLIGEILNLRDIEQGLEQLNRLNSYHYSIDIQAGSKNRFISFIHLP
ncbi:Hemolysin transporter protein shlB precursor [Moellerella wisconsensis]|nr:Hemolysin transporter protein shlB precursor [Moellerella wisconsensis]